MGASTGGDRFGKKNVSSKRPEVQRSSKVAPPTQAPNRPTNNPAPTIVAPATLPPVIAPPFPQTLPPSQEAMTAPVGQAHPASQHDIEQTLPNLSADERAKLYSAHEAAMHNPDLAALRERYLREKRAYREELQRALLKADPSVQPILEKVRKRPAGDK